MNTLLLHPTDVLFFRDGRPMSGSLSGHGAAWPLPTVTNAALHAALHRASVNGQIKNDQGEPVNVHGHNHRHNEQCVTDARKFGSLVTAGPFPVIKGKDGKAIWLFPRPLDAGLDENENDSPQPTFLPLENGINWDQHSSLPKPLRYPVANNHGPTKKKPAPWWNAAAWETYLGSSESGAKPDYHKDERFSDTEFTYGIGINSTTGTQDGERFYSAHYLRLREDCRLGLFAEAQDKINGSCANKRDLIAAIFPNSGSQTPIIVGGQQRLCTVERQSGIPLPLPKGKTTGFESQDAQGKTIWLVKWVLLTPAIFQEIGEHKGGWLPNWIDHQTGEIQLLDGPGRNAANRRKVPQGSPISATLVAALVDKPIPVTGYALLHKAAEREHGGAKPTHLAVPAGSVYYFECNGENGKDDASKLASALNWHGSETSPTTIKNRRSTLFGEKGFGLGVCSTWQLHSGIRPSSRLTQHVNPIAHPQASGFKD